MVEEEAAAAEEVDDAATTMKSRRIFAATAVHRLLLLQLTFLHRTAVADNLGTLYIYIYVHLRYGCLRLFEM